MCLSSPVTSSHTPHAASQELGTGWQLVGSSIDQAHWRGKMTAIKTVTINYLGMKHKPNSPRNRLSLVPQPPTPPHPHHLPHAPHCSSLVPPAPPHPCSSPLTAPPWRPCTSLVPLHLPGAPAPPWCPCSSPLAVHGTVSAPLLPGHLVPGNCAGGESPLPAPVRTWAGPHHPTWVHPGARGTLKKGSIQSSRGC